MKFLFLHQNFPGQFAHLAPALAQSGHQVLALTSRVDKPQRWRGIQFVPYQWEDPKDQKHHPWLTTLNGAVHRGAVVFRAADAMKAKGFTPDVIIAHSGWGEALFAQDVWPDARVGIFNEFFYTLEGADLGFDQEFEIPGAFGEVARIRLRNMAMRMQLERAHSGLSPTKWQASTYPDDLRRKITVVHDGIDTAVASPDPNARFQHDGLDLSREDEVITFVNRNLEPYRGFHVFMRNLPDLLVQRPKATVVIVGADGVSYGAAPKNGKTWKDLMLAEVRHKIADHDWDRVRFVGKIPNPRFLNLLQVSTVHVYLTYPFVLSWSLMEAMSVRCAIVASDTQPVAEVITDGETGLLFDFFDGARMVEQICTLCSDADLRARLGRAARRRIIERYDLKSVCLPRQFDWVSDLAGGLGPVTQTGPET